MSPENAWAALELAEKRPVLDKAIQLVQQEPWEEKHPIREPAARPDPELTEKDLQLKRILQPLYGALTQYTPTGRWNGAAKREAAGVLKQAIKGNIGALEQRLTSANKAAFMALITEGKLGGTIATQLAAISPPINASDSKSQKPISIDDLIQFLQRHYRKNHAASLDHELKSQHPIFGTDDLLGIIKKYLPAEELDQLATSQHSPSFFNCRLVKDDANVALSEVWPEIGQKFLMPYGRFMA